MIVKLTEITKEEIKQDAQNAVNDGAMQIMYLHNNGKNNSKWNKNDFMKVLEDDIEQ